MGIYERLSKKEVKLVETSINHLLGSNVFDIFVGKELIKIIDRRTEIFLVPKEDLFLFDNFSSLLPEKILIIAHARIKLGFFIQKKFLIGIESLAFLAPFARKRVQLDAHNTRSFIFGKDVEINTDSLQNQLEYLDKDATVMVFSSTNIPLGYVRIISNGTKKWLQNLIDIGVFLRSEKSAF